MAWQIGTGTATAATPSGVIGMQIGTVGNVTTGEDTLHTYTMPANTLIETGRGLHVVDTGSTANSIHAKTFKFYFGSTVILTVSFNTSTVYTWVLEGWIVRTGLNSQKYYVEMRAAIGTSPISFITQGDLTETETGAIEIKVTGEGVASNDIVARAFSVLYF